MEIYPNPSRSFAGIFLKNYSGKNIKVNLFDPTGKVILKKEIATAEGSSYYPLKVNPQLAAGHYILNVRGDGLRQSLKIVIE